jgi:hypothetical protein
LKFRPSAAIAALLALALVGASSRTSEPAPQQGGAQNHRVTILYQCNATRTVSPWQVRIKQGDTGEWVLEDASDVTDFEIEKKRALQRWLFDTWHPARGRKGEPARGDQMRATSRGTHASNLEAMCPGPGNSMQKAVIDPDTIVD